MRPVLCLLGCVLPPLVSSSKPNFLARQLPQQDICLTQVTVEHQIAPTVSGQPIVVITPILADTIITPSPYNVPITITNAPTYLNTTITAYSTITRTIIHTYITLTKTYKGSITSTTTILNSLGPDATTTVLVLVPQTSSNSFSLSELSSSSLDQFLPLFISTTSLYDSNTSPSPFVTPSFPGSARTIPGQTPRIFIQGPMSLLPSQNILPVTLSAQGSLPTAQTPSPVMIDNTPIQSPISVPSQGFPSIATPAESITQGGSASQIVSPPITTTPLIPTNIGQTAAAPPEVTLAPIYQTITELYAGQITTTSTLDTPKAPGGIGTVLLLLPSVYTTTTQLYTGTDSLDSPITSTIAIPIVAGQTGTVQILVPKSFVTIAKLYPGLSMSTTTLLDPVTVGQTGTVQLLLPSVYTTRSALYTGLITATTTLSVPTAVGETGVVLVQLPSVYVTITSIYTGVTTASSVLFVPTLPGETGTVLVQNPQQASVIPTSSAVSALVPKPVTTGLCGIQGASPDGTCLSTLPPACQNFARASLLDSLLNTADALACQAALGVLGTVNAVGCFTGSLLSGLTGSNLLTCIKANVPMCNSCLDTLPSSCRSLGSSVSILGVNELTISACKLSLGIFASSSAAACFAVPNLLFPPSGQSVLNCLQQNIPICPSSPPATPSALIAPTTVLGCDGTSQPTSCVPALPPQCTAAALKPSGAPLGNVLDTVDTAACQLALGALGTVNAAVCFSRNLLAAFTDWDFISCISTRVPLCNRCLIGLPSACQVAGEQVGGVCQAALGLYGITTAATCFAGDVVARTVDGNLAGCLGRRLPFCDGLAVP